MLVLKVMITKVKRHYVVVNATIYNSKHLKDVYLFKIKSVYILVHINIQRGP